MVITSSGTLENAQTHMQKKEVLFGEMPCILADGVPFLKIRSFRFECFQILTEVFFVCMYSLSFLPIISPFFFSSSKKQC